MGKHKIADNDTTRSLVRANKRPKRYQQQQDEVKKSVFPGTTIESGSTELWNEFFDYLSLLDILQAFSGLNSRINAIICCSYPIYIDLSYTSISYDQFQGYCRYALRTSSHYIKSLKLSNVDNINAIKLFKSICDISQFLSLQKLILIKPDRQDILDLFPKVNELKELSTIEIINYSDITIDGVQNVKFLKTLSLKTIHRDSFHYLRASSIEQLTIEYCELNLFYYLNPCLKYLKVNNYLWNRSSRHQRELDTAIYFPHLIHLDIGIQNIWSESEVFADIEFIFSKIASTLEYFSLSYSTTICYYSNYWSGHYWPKLLSSLTRTCRIQLFVRASYLDFIPNFPQIQASFENNPFWRDHPVKIYYDQTNKLFCFHTLPYPQTAQDTQWHFENTLIAAVGGSRYDDNADVSFTNHQQISTTLTIKNDYEKYIYLPQRFDHSVQQLKLDLPLHVIPIDNICSILDKKFGKTCGKLTMLYFNDGYNTDERSQEFLFKLFECMPKLLEIKFSSKNSTTLKNMLSLKIHSIESLILVQCYEPTINDIDLISLSLPNLKKFECSISTITGLKQILCLCLKKMIYLVYLRITTSKRLYKDSFKNWIEYKLKNSRYKVDNGLQIWL
ncbi:unnamed protein product [Didymodactylos carnosus]|uniref:Uncharacterized protein n=1 Tax=Didymodactylos carnosus TaxID=1234261 RepID=A0A8S2DG80_9BILA|nr:unnamed protein product [Didymodactylos carnosus]CAF3699304.1 unnamed protein product [Didymodactylos carnosus]